MKAFFRPLLLALPGCFVFCAALLAQAPPAGTDLVKAYPLHWYAGMQWNKVQIILQSPQAFDKATRFQVQYPGLQLVKQTLLDNPQYAALDLVLSPRIQPGSAKIAWQSKTQKGDLVWPIKARRKGNGTAFAQGVRSADFIYLLMPDRFSNGDPSNDRWPAYQDQVVDRKDPIKRHGGDLQGVQQHLDYLKDLGVTALWMTPVIENDMPLQEEQAGKMAGYHGYWFTNHYAIDQRLGGEKAYAALVEAAHQKGIKIIQDAVYNHVGIEHWFYKNPPAQDWINRWPTYTGTHHREEAVLDPNGSAADKERMIKGWFVPHLPDVNLANPYVANYMIQHALWTVEHFGIDGWRVDTYKYCDEAFMNRVNTALLKDFPQLSIFGETTSNTVLGSAYFTRNNLAKGFHHNVPGVTDFPLQSAMLETLNGKFGWTNGVNKLYMTLAQDLLYADPLTNCIFLDNHDTERFLSMVGEDRNKFNMGMNLLFTLRGIPQLYYGTELWMKNTKEPNDGMVRLEVMGGFPGDARNAFAATGRTPNEEAAFQYVRTLARFRQQNPALQKGSLRQWIPNDGVYVYERRHQKNVVVCLFNTADKQKTIDLTAYLGAEADGGWEELFNPSSKGSRKTQWTLAAGTSKILFLQP